MGFSLSHTNKERRICMSHKFVANSLLIFVLSLCFGIAGCDIFDRHPNVVINEQEYETMQEPIEKDVQNCFGGQSTIEYVEENIISVETTGGVEAGYEDYIKASLSNKYLGSRTIKNSWQAVIQEGKHVTYILNREYIVAAGTASVKGKTYPYHIEITTNIEQANTISHECPAVNNSSKVTTSNSTIASGSYYFVIPKHSDKCLGIAADSRENGAAVVQWDCVGADNQKWKFTDQSGYYTVSPKHSDKCLGIAADSRENGAAVVQWDCVGADNQLWKLVSVGDYFNVIPKHSDKCLGIAADSRENGAAVVQWGCVGADNQLWSLISVP